jgi:hypothetical protein
MGSCYYPFPAVNKVTMPFSDPTYDCSAFGQVASAVPDFNLLLEENLFSLD